MSDWRAWSDFALTDAIDASLQALDPTFAPRLWFSAMASGAGLGVLTRKATSQEVDQ